MRIEDFDELIEFPKRLQGVVYVLFWQAVGGVPKPFYVGQTGRFLSSRIAEYLYADFQAATDFKVGEVIQCLIHRTGGKVLVGQRLSENPAKDELKLIADLEAQGFLLLNRKLGFDYKTADKAEQLKKIQYFCEELPQT